MESLFKLALGADFERLPAPIRQLHRLRETTVFTGTAQIEGASGPLGAILARWFRLPRPGRDVPVEVTITPGLKREIWRRRFGGSEFVSTLTLTRQARRMTERFGWVSFSLEVESAEEGLDLNIVGAKAGILKLPHFAVPWTVARERVDDRGRFTFDVEIGLRGIGRLVRYRGWLVG